MRTDTLNRDLPAHDPLALANLATDSLVLDPLAAELGQRGEDLAADYLTQRGLVVLSRNWRCRDGELDVVATDGRALVVCEVKTRSTDDFGDPSEFVTVVKMRRIRRATHAWLKRYQVGWCEIRFDVVTVVWPASGRPKLRHLRGAF
jgi:putative endonuclease